MSSSYGEFVWCELMTTDTSAATSFYCAAIGWTARDAGMEYGDYTILSAGPAGVGGLMGIPSAARAGGARPGWTAYITVDDVDAAARRVKDAGGAVHRGPDDIPNVGRFAVVTDPQGAAFSLLAPLGTREGPPPARNTPGLVGWHELHAADWPAAFAFYADMFGWTKGDAIDMGPMGTYQLFAIDGVPCGGMMTKSDAIPAPVWLYYFNVDDINTAVARVKDAGGQVLNGPMEVPGGSWIAQCTDPQGAMFAMVHPAG